MQRAAVMTRVNANCDDNSSTVSSVATARSTRARPEDCDSESNDGNKQDEDDRGWEERADDQDMNDMNRESCDDDDDDDDDNKEEEAQSPMLPMHQGSLREKAAALQWRFDQVNEDFQMNKPEDACNGPSGLKPRVGSSFHDAFECLERCGGLSKDLILKSVVNSKQCFQSVVRAKHCDRNNVFGCRRTCSTFQQH